MNDLTLIRKSLFRKKTRAILLILSIMTAFLIFGALSSVDRVFNSGAEMAQADRLVTVNKINFTLSMPIAYYNRVQATEGVQDVTHASWFQGYYQEPVNFVQAFAVDMESYLRVYPELSMPDDQRTALLQGRTCVALGEDLAAQYGWELGQRFPLGSGIWSKSDGSRIWEVDVCAIFGSEVQDIPTNYLMLHYDYYNEDLAFNQDQIGWMVLLTGDAERNQSVIDAIDSQFANSRAETETTTEAAFSQAFVEQLGNIGLILGLVVGAAFATILMIVGTTMVMAIHERTKEVAVMKILGFSAPRIFTHVISESVLLSFIGGIFGIGLAAGMIYLISQVPAMQMPSLRLAPSTLMQALAIMVGFGGVTGLAPAINAMRINIVDALGKE